MLDTWSDDTGCWADVYDDDHEEMQACEARCASPSSVIGASVRVLRRPLVRFRENLPVQVLSWPDGKFSGEAEFTDFCA